MRARVGVVPQADALDPDFTVEENLRTWASYFGLERGIDARVRELVAFAALQGRERSGVGTLSGGMRRRLTLARALLNAPDLVVLDEPITGLDPQARQHIWQRLRELRGRGVTLLLTTHYMEEAERLCDRLAVIDGGRIVAEGAPRELIRAMAKVQSHSTSNATSFVQRAAVGAVGQKGFQLSFFLGTDLAVDIGVDQVPVFLLYRHWLVRH